MTTPARMTHTLVDHPSQLNALSTLPLFRPLQRAPVRLGGALEKHPQREAWERDINRHMRACGCSSAANGLLLGLVLAGAAVAYRAIATDGGITLSAAAALVAMVAIGGAVIGKLAGLAAANRRLKATVAQVQSQWTPETPPGNPGIVCG